jgi:hypothetical protein
VDVEADEQSFELVQPGEGALDERDQLCAVVAVAAGSLRVWGRSRAAVSLLSHPETLLVDQL